MSQIPTTQPQESLETLLERLGSKLETPDSGKLVGIPSPTDVARIVTVRQTLGTRARTRGNTAPRRRQWQKG